MSEILVQLFGGDYAPHPLGYGQAAMRGLAAYGGGLILARLGSVRLLGHATGMDILLAILLGSVLARAVNGSGSLSGSLIACGMMVAMHTGIARLCARNHTLGRIVKGQPIKIIADGKPIKENLAQANLSPHDVEEGLRLNANLADMADVKVAYLERNGEIGIVKKKD